MDILNFISWIKRGDYKEVLPTDTINLIPVGSRDPKRDDDYRPLSVNAGPLQSVYNTGSVTQTGSIANAVTLDTYNGVITTVTATTAANSTESTPFKVFNKNIKSTSKILLSCEYKGSLNGIPTAVVTAINANPIAPFFAIRLGNGGSVPLDIAVKIHFIILE